MPLLIILVLVIATSVGAWIVRARLRRRIQNALGIAPSNEVELTSIRTWMRVEEEQAQQATANPASEVLARREQTPEPPPPVYFRREENECLPVRQDRRMFLPFKAALPPFCLRCGKPTHTYKELTLTWFPEGSDAIYLLLGVVAVRKVTLSLPLCPAHLWRRAALKLNGVLLVLAAVPVGLFAGDDLAWGFATGLLTVMLMFMAGVVMWWRSEVLHIRQIEEDGIVLSGAAEEFLNILQVRQRSAGASAGL